MTSGNSPVGVEAVGVVAGDERFGEPDDDAGGGHLEVAAGVVAGDVVQLADRLEQACGPLGLALAVVEVEGERVLEGGQGRLAVEQGRGRWRSCQGLSSAVSGDWVKTALLRYGSSPLARFIRRIESRLNVERRLVPAALP